MAAVTPLRKRFVMLVAIVCVGLVVNRVIAFGGGDDSGSDATAQLTRSGAAEPAIEPSIGPAARSASDASAVLRLDRLEARQAALGTDASARGALFEPLSWQPAAPKVVVAPLAPPRPVAPAFPYAYIGGLSDGGERTGFFAHGERVLPVRAGDTVDAMYHVDQMNETQMTLTYLPLNESMTVVFGAVR